MERRKKFPAKYANEIENLELRWKLCEKKSVRDSPNHDKKGSNSAKKESETPRTKKRKCRVMNIFHFPRHFSKCHEIRYVKPGRGKRRRADDKRKGQGWKLVVHFFREPWREWETKNKSWQSFDLEKGLRKEGDREKWRKKITGRMDDAKEGRAHYLNE